MAPVHFSCQSKSWVKDLFNARSIALWFFSTTILFHGWRVYFFSNGHHLSIDMLECIVAINWEEDNSAQSKEDHYIGAFLPSFGRISWNYCYSSKLTFQLIYGIIGCTSFHSGERKGIWIARYFFLFFFFLSEYLSMESWPKSLTAWGIFSSEMNSDI